MNSSRTNLEEEQYLKRFVELQKKGEDADEERIELLIKTKLIFDYQHLINLIQSQQISKSLYYIIGFLEMKKELMKFTDHACFVLLLDENMAESSAEPITESSSSNSHHFDQDKYEQWLLSKSEMFQHLWLSLCILRMFQFLFHDNLQDKELNTTIASHEPPKHFSILKSWLGNTLKQRNSKLFNMLFLLTLDFKRYACLVGLSTFQRLCIEHSVSLRNTLICKDYVPEISLLALFKTDQDIYRELNSKSRHQSRQ
ncbi:hypothetical protein C9374_004782 [Naegleria lovaniensis]|uniref:Uncharacterized protein n=1 Tax=Naegleria lovaniensis TaxID=51637 RepID=A0AA88GRL3_NAELO|nr:uncharacterized protein C9374_004782 [Naegleria lovaniensis]KAG2382815.1 hypothetical protein C9374_004782 [Naegleria lovaniensis]